MRTIFVHSVDHRHGFGANAAAFDKDDLKASMEAWDEQYPADDDSHDVSQVSFADPAFDAMLAALKSLQAWAVTMGGWDAACWEEATKAIALAEGAPAVPAMNTTDTAQVDTTPDERSP